MIQIGDFVLVGDVVYEVYEINKDKTKGQLFATYKNNKIKKCK